MSTRTLQITFLGDTTKLADALDEAETELRNTGEQLDALADAGGNAEQALQGMADISGFLGDQFGIQVGPLKDLTAAYADFGGGIEALLQGGPALVKQLIALPAAIGPAIASTWAYVTALWAQAAAFIAANAPLIALVGGLALLAGGIVLLVKHWDDVVAKFPALGVAVDGVQAKLGAFTGWVTGTFVPEILGIFTAVKEAIDRAVGYVRDHWDEIRAVIEPALQALKVIVETHWKAFQTVIETALGVIKGVIDTFMGVFTGDWERAWDGVKQIVGSVWQGIKGLIETAITGIKELAPSIRAAGESLGKALLDGLKAALSATAGFAGDVAGAVLAAVKEIINSQVIDRINRTLEFSFDTKIPGIGTIHIDPKDIPHLAAGGIVMRPTLALIGEAGPEAVVPLGAGMGRGGSLGNHYELHFHGFVGDVEELAVRIRREFERGY